jgi:tRNA(Arg) A34 adenosine deaminase TadA
MTEPELSSGALGRVLDVIEREIVPLTRAGVARGDKVFGAAILRRSDLSTVVAATNRETENPLFHGEVSAINAYYAIVAEDGSRRWPPGDSLFLATHEPCAMCASAIAWGGYPAVVYLFSHEDSRDAFAIGHDLTIMEALFGRGPGDYNRDNAYFTARSLPALIAAAPEPERAALEARVAGLRAIYAELSDAYQARKHDSPNILRR